MIPLRGSRGFICLVSLSGGRHTAPLSEAAMISARELAPAPVGDVRARALLSGDAGSRHPEQRQMNAELKRLSDETGIPLVATNDVHYVERDDSEAHDVLLCIQTGKTVDDTDRLRFETREFYLKTPRKWRRCSPGAPRRSKTPAASRSDARSNSILARPTCPRSSWKKAWTTRST